MLRCHDLPKDLSGAASHYKWIIPPKNPKTLSDRNQTDQQKDKQRPSNNRNIVDWRVCVKLQDWLDDTVVTSVSKFQILIQNKPWIWTQMASICFCGSDLIV